MGGIVFQKLTKTQVKAAIKKQGVWSGYLAGNKVSTFHISQGWHLGIWVEIKTIEELDSTCVNFEYYLDRELGSRTAFYSLK